MSREAMQQALEALPLATFPFKSEPMLYRSDVLAALAQPTIKDRLTVEEERNFCPRCGKRLASGFVEIAIHTCTPPEKNT